MTYCVGLILDRGVVLAADTRTNAGIDNVAVFKKLHTWQWPGDRAIMMAAAGNLAVTQAVVSYLNEEVEARPRKGVVTLKNAPTFFQAARIVGRAIREVRKIDGEALAANGESFQVSFILGGQIKKERPRLFQIYSEGNFIEAGPDTPFFQIGEHKYGKPILDRVADLEMRLGEAAKLILLSFDSTLRSNLSVGLPIDIALYRRDELKIDRMRRIEQNDPYFHLISEKWSEALRNAFINIEELDI